MRNAVVLRERIARLKDLLVQVLRGVDPARSVGARDD